MAHFAKVENGVVTQVIVVGNEDCGGGEFPASEVVGREFIASCGIEGEYFQCSYSASFRNAYPGSGWIWKAKPRSKDGGQFEPPIVENPIIETPATT